MRNIDIHPDLPLEEKLTLLKTNCLVVDIETSAHYSDGNEIDIQGNFDEYVAKAKVKWIGCYSYKLNKHFIFTCNDNKSDFIQLISSHDIIVGFNLEEFDYPILYNNGYIPEKNHLLIDCMIILGKSSFFTKNGYPYKNRGELMDYDFSSNSLRHMASVMGLETQKGDIDYKIFHKTEWHPKEENQITTYLLSDINATKQMFDKMWEYWKPFTKFLPSQSIYDLSWIRASIAAVIYKSACKILGVEPSYSDNHSKSEEMGGNVITPKVEEARKVWYVDFASLYPHVMAMFNLFDETPVKTSGENVFIGNKLFQVRGSYNISEQHPLSKVVMNFLEKRISLKKESPKDPMVYTLKIFLNGLYGVVRSSIFEKIYKPNAGWDTCWLGQQFQAYTISRMSDMGFDTIYGDTDSVMAVARDEKHNNREYVRSCLDTIVKEIMDNVPFPAKTFDIAIEQYIDYILFPFEEQAKLDENGETIKIKNRIVKERKGKKKNYLYIYTDKSGEKHIEIKGFPIIKNNATQLGMEIFNSILKQKILLQCHARFTKTEIDNIINDYLKNPNIMEWISQEYKVRPLINYKKENQIQAQISKEYFNGAEGTIRLIKNNKVGRVGKGTKYCTIEEAISNKLTAEDLDLTKLWNELNPFIQPEA